jgi:hypothetical protein
MKAIFIWVTETGIHKEKMQRGAADDKALLLKGECYIWIYDDLTFMLFLL